MENPFVVAATMAQVQRQMNAEYKPSWEVVGEARIKGDSFPVMRKVSMKKGKYMPHQGKKEMERRVRHAN